MITAVIPAYNEQDHIAEVVSKTKKHVDKVIVVNDGSKDDTASLAFQAGGEVVSPDYKLGGAGAATSYGIRYALLELKYNDIIVTLDGDGQHNPDDIPALIRQIDAGADLVIGSRFMIQGDMPFYRWVGNQVINYTCNVFNPVKISDTQCGLRAFRSQVLKDIQIETNNFGFCSEVVIKARANAYDIREVPIQCIYHNGFKANSTLNPIRHALQVQAANLKWRWKVEWH